MKISEIYSAMRLKIKLNYEDDTVDFQEGNLINIEATQDRQTFLVSQYGEGVKNTKSVLCGVSVNTANYLNDLSEGQQEAAFKCMFLITDIENSCIEVQTYTFQSVTEYKTPINIMVSNDLLESTSVEKLQQDYVWTQSSPNLCVNFFR